MGLSANKIEIKRAINGMPESINLSFNTRQLLMFYLTIKAPEFISSKDPKEREYGAQMQAAAKVFDQYLTAIEFILTKKKGEFKTAYKATRKPEEDESVAIEKITEALKYPGVELIIRELIIRELIIKSLQEGYNVPGVKKTYKQPLTLSKDLAKNSAEDNNQTSLFSLPLEQVEKAYNELAEQYSDGLPYKEKISQKTGILSLILIKNYQDNNVEKNKEGFIKITDIAAIADELNTDIKELKYFLLYLAGYQYPSVRQYEEQNEVGIMFAKMFDIEFIYDQAGKEKVINNDTIKMNNSVELIIGAPLKYLRVKPSDRYLKDLEGKKGRLGYVNVNDNLPALCLGLSLYAYKVLHFSQSFPPAFKIGEAKLLENIGLKYQAKKQGLPRIRKTLAAAFKELQDKGHFKEYTLPFNEEGKIPDDAGDLYTWTYTDEHTKHKFFNKKEDEKPTIEYVDFKDKSIPLEARIKAYKAFLSNKGTYTPGHLQNAVNKHFKEELEAAK